MGIVEKETEQAKLVLELQKENRELRMQLAKHQQKLLILQAQSLNANATSSSPTPPSATSSLLTPPTAQAQAQAQAQNPKRRPTANCFSFTPDSKKKAGGAGAQVAGTTAGAAGVAALQRTVKTLEGEIERMKRDHSLQMKQKDEVIRELMSQKVGKVGKTRGGTLRPKDENGGELRSPSHRFKSPAPPPKKRSFWDITTANSPSVATLNGRKTRSHVVSEPNAPPPSMLLQVRYIHTYIHSFFFFFFISFPSVPIFRKLKVKILILILKLWCMFLFWS